MEAFSNHHHPSFLLDTVFQPTTTAAAATTTTTAAAATSFSQFYFPESHEEIPVDLSIYESSCLENEENGTKKDEREVKGKKAKKCNGGVVKKGEKEKKTRGGGNYKIKEDLELISEDKKVPTEYVYVRARRGKATSKHSLAERVRRQKISERMNHLQALVPGCDQVTGKLLLLDHIINYVQSLQNQVEEWNGMGSPLSNEQQWSLEQAVNTVFFDTTTAPDNYPLLDNVSTLQFDEQVLQMPNILPQFLSMKLASVNPKFFNSGIDLYAFILTAEEWDGMGSPLPNQQQWSLEQVASTAFSDTTTAPDNYPLLDNVSTLQLDEQVLQMPNILPQEWNGMGSPLPNEQQWSLEQAVSTVFSDTTTAPDNYPLLDNVYTHQFDEQVLQMPNILPQDNGQLWWDVLYQRQEQLNQYGFTTNFCSYN